MLPEKNNIRSEMKRHQQKTNKRIFAFSLITAAPFSLHLFRSYYPPCIRLEVRANWQVINMQRLIQNASKKSPPERPGPAIGTKEAVSFPRKFYPLLFDLSHTGDFLHTTRTHTRKRRIKKKGDRNGEKDKREHQK